MSKKKTTTLGDIVCGRGLEHKKHCVWALDPEWGLTGHFVHRVPIDCCTIQDLWNANEQKTKELADLKEELTSLKARLYDFEHEE